MMTGHRARTILDGMNTTGEPSADALDRIATALERIADKIAPPPPAPWQRVECKACGHFVTGPPEMVADWTENHAAEYGHRELNRADDVEGSL